MRPPAIVLAMLLAACGMGPTPTPSVDAGADAADAIVCPSPVWRDCTISPQSPCGYVCRDSDGGASF